MVAEHFADDGIFVSIDRISMNSVNDSTTVLTIYRRNREEISRYGCRLLIQLSALKTCSLSNIDVQPCRVVSLA